MHLIRPLRFADIQFCQVLPNLLFRCSGKDFAPPSPIYRFKDLRDMGNLMPVKNKVKSPQTSLYPLSPVLPAHLLGDPLSLAFLCWPMNYRFLSCYSSHPLPSPFHLCFSFPGPISTHLDHIPALFPGHLPLLPLAVHCLLIQCEHQILAQTFCFPSCLAWILHIRMKTSCALRTYG